MKRQILAAAALGTLLLTACGDDTSSESTTAPTAAPTTAAAAPDTTAAASDTTAAAMTGGDAAACADGKTLAAGELTIATGDPAFPPYVIDDAPESGEGFEAALALAVAKEMGFEGDAVKWVRTSFDTAVAGSDTNFDFNLQQFTINDERKQVVSFSDPYYTANQAVVGYADGPGKDVTKLSDLKSLRLGAAAGTTSLQFILDVVKPDAEPFAFNSNADAKTALDNKQIDAIITDLPTGLYISAVEIEGAKVFGQFPIDAGGAGDQWGLLLVKDNPLTECTNLALANLTESGELASITDEWMGQWTEAPTLSKD
ncbi:MAG: ABC transporter substrate-binding protein [Ilumatobacteraceae bacterium]